MSETRTEILRLFDTYADATRDGVYDERSVKAAADIVAALAAAPAQAAPAAELNVSNSDLDKWGFPTHDESGRELSIFGRITQHAKLDASPTRTQPLRDRCRVALECVPASPFRDHLSRLFDDLLAVAPQAAADEFEIRADGKTVRADRWQVGIRRIVALLWGNRHEFEVDEVVEAVSKLIPEPFNEGDDEGLVRAVLDAPQAAPAPQPERRPGAAGRARLEATPEGRQALADARAQLAAQIPLERDFASVLEKRAWDLYEEEPQPEAAAHPLVDSTERSGQAVQRAAGGGAVQPVTPSIAHALTLISDYFDLGVLEGRERREHDTPDGAAGKKWNEIRVELRRLATPPAVESVERDAARWRLASTSRNFGITRWGEHGMAALYGDQAAAAIDAALAQGDKELQP